MFVAAMMVVAPLGGDQHSTVAAVERFRGRPNRAQFSEQHIDTLFTSRGTASNEAAKQKEGDRRHSRGGTSKRATHGLLTTLYDILHGPPETSDEKVTLFSWDYIGPAADSPSRIRRHPTKAPPHRLVVAAPHRLRPLTSEQPTGRSRSGSTKSRV